MVRHRNLQGQAHAAVAVAAPYFLGFILLIMGLAFVWSLYVAFTTPTGRSTLPKRSVASSVLKMTGGFMAGFAMALLK